MTTFCAPPSSQKKEEWGFTVYPKLKQYSVGDVVYYKPSDDFILVQEERKAVQESVCTNQGTWSKVELPTLVSFNNFYKFLSGFDSSFSSHNNNLFNIVCKHPNKMFKDLSEVESITELIVLNDAEKFYCLNISEDKKIKHNLQKEIKKHSGLIFLPFVLLLIFLTYFFWNMKKTKKVSPSLPPPKKVYDPFEHGVILI